MVPRIEHAVEVAVGDAPADGGDALACVRTDQGRVFCWDSVSSGSSPHADAVTVPVYAVPSIADAQSVAAGGSFACALRPAGAVSCWGVRAHGQLGDGGFFGDAATSPVRNPWADGAVEIALGGFRACARRGDGTIVCWGGPRRDLTVASTPPEGATRPLDTARRATRILVGGAGAYACWTDAEGALSCSGTHRYTPEQLATLAGANRVRASDGALCGIFRNHTLRCLGRPLCSISSDPTDIGLQGSDERRVDDVALGSCFYCIRATDSQAYCVGTNDRGQLGDGSTASYGGRTHVVAQLGAIEQIVASEQFVCARLTTGSARCWGTNSLGELGDGTYVQRRTPTQPVGVSNVIDIALGRHHACALHPDGTVACWGNNDRGQLGDGSNVRRNVARPVPNLTGVLDVEASDDFTCALTHDHTVYCWGANESGEIGSGTRSDDPVRVAME